MWSEGTAHLEGQGVRRRLPVKILKLRPSEIAFPAILESNFDR